MLNELRMQTVLILTAVDSFYFRLLDTHYKIHKTMMCVHFFLYDYFFDSFFALNFKLDLMFDLNLEHFNRKRSVNY